MHVTDRSLRGRPKNKPGRNGRADPRQLHLGHAPPHSHPRYTPSLSTSTSQPQLLRAVCTPAWPPQAIAIWWACEIKSPAKASTKEMLAVVGWHRLGVHVHGQFGVTLQVRMQWNTELDQSFLVHASSRGIHVSRTERARIIGGSIGVFSCASALTTHPPFEMGTAVAAADCPL